MSEFTPHGSKKAIAKAVAFFSSVLRVSSSQNQNHAAASCLVDNFGISLRWVLILFSIPERDIRKGVFFLVKEIRAALRR